MKHNTTIKKGVESDNNKNKKINFIDRKINKLRKNKKSNIAMLIVDFYDFYKKELYKKHIILYVISLIIFFIMLLYFFNINNTGEFDSAIKEIVKSGEILGKRANFRSIFVDKIFLNFILLFSGITPYVYVPVLGVMYSCTLAGNIFTAFKNIAINMSPTFLTIGSIIQLFGVTLTSSMGIYYCKMCTKKFKYNQKSNFTLNDLKKEYYEIKKDDKKAEELSKKIENRNKEIEKLNVKIPYKYLLISFLISSIIIIIGGIITLI